MEPKQASLELAWGLVKTIGGAGAAVLILAFDTSSLSGSVALLDGPRVLVERVLDPARRSAQTLAPAIAELLAMQQL